MYTYEQTREDFKSGRLGQFVVNNKCEDKNILAYHKKGETLNIFNIKNNLS